MPKFSIAQDGTVRQGERSERRHLFPFPDCFATRPAVKLLALYLIGLLGGYWLDLSVYPVLGFGIVLLIAAGIIRVCAAEPHCWHQSCLALCIMAGAFVRYELATRYFPENHISGFTDRAEKVWLRGEITSYPDRRPGFTNLTLTTSFIQLHDQIASTKGDVLVRVYDDSVRFAYGDRILVHGKLRDPRDQRNPGEFDYKAYLHARGVYGILSVYRLSDIQVISRQNGSWLFRNTVINLKGYIEQYIVHALPPAEAALLKGLLIGERGEISVQTRDAFARLGVIHILAVSGLHVGFIIMIFVAVAGMLRVPLPIRVITTILALVFYACVTKLSPPVVRASIMGGLGLLAISLERKSDIYNVLAVAAIAILVISPLQLFQAGFQLSFAAVLAIAYGYNYVRKLRLIPWLGKIFRHNALARYLLDSLAVSAAVSIGTAPLTLLYFQRLPLYGLLANLVVVPLAFCSLATAIVASLVNLILPALAEVYMAAACFFLTAILKIVAWGSQLPGATLDYAGLSGFSALLVGVAIVFLTRLGQRKARFWFIIYALAIANFLVWQKNSRPADRMLIRFLDVGQGDAILLSLPDQRHILVDAGPRSPGYDAGSRVIGPFLKRRGISGLDLLVLSHADSDHLGGVPYLLRHFRVKEIWDNGISKETELYREYITLVDSLGITRESPSCGTLVQDFAPLQLFILHPGAAFAGEGLGNEASLSLKISYGEVDILLAGDVEEKGEAQICRFGSWLQSEILKVNHHGSRTSTTGPFLDLVEPTIAVFSVGKLNRFGHPHPDVLNRIKSKSIRIFRTDRDAAVILETNGDWIKPVIWR